MNPLHHRWGRATHRRSTSNGRTVPSTVAALASEPRASCCIAAGCPCPRCCDRGIAPRQTLVTGAVPATPNLAAPAQRPARTHTPAPTRGQKASKTRALHHDKCRWEARPGDSQTPPPSSPHGWLAGCCSAPESRPCCVERRPYDASAPGSWQRERHCAPARSG